MSTLSKCPLSSLTKTSCIFAMSGKSPGLIWCSRCSCEYLTICFYFLLWIPDNLFNMASTQFIDLLIMFSGKPWENISDLHFVQCFYKLTMLPLKHKWILKLWICWAEPNLQCIQTLDQFLLLLLLSKHTWHVLLQTGDDVGVNLIWGRCEWKQSQNYLLFVPSLTALSW